MALLECKLPCKPEHNTPLPPLPPMITGGLRCTTPST
jgi:hypothetical protein